MKKYHFLLIISSFIIIGLTVYGCSKYYINSGFRKNYKNVNEFIHNDSLDNHFFKVHFKNGDVCILDEWNLSKTQDSIYGQGKMFDFNRNQIQDGTLGFPIKNVAIIETNDLEPIQSKDKSRVAALTLLTAVNVAVDALCITNPKACFGSCPTFYNEGNSTKKNANAEGFSSSISPSLERQDLDDLQYTTDLDEFRLTMTNEAFETHMINQIVLNAVSKEKGQSIYHDKNGVFYNCDKPIKPNKAIVNQKNVNSKVNKIDNREYYSKTDKNNLSETEEIILDFNPSFSGSKGLVVNFRQTLLTTFLLYSGISYMGNEVGDYFAKIETNNAVKKQLSNPFKKLGKIKFSYWDNKLYKWVLFDQIYETGPIAKNLMMVPLPANRADGDRIKIKLELTKGLWRLDYLGLAKINNIAKAISINPCEVDIISGENYTAQEVLEDDDQYLISFPGNEFNFKFSLPELKPNQEYALFLSSKGYYLEWIRSNWVASKDITRLRKMLLNNNSEWNRLANEFKTLEPDMESVFWNSKYSNIQ